MLKEYNGIQYEYDPTIKKYFNPTTNKWVVKPRNSKGKAKGKSIKIIESKEFRYILFNTFHEFDSNLNQRINIFLTKLIEKYNVKRNRRIRDDRSYEDLSIYFSSKDLTYILGKDHLNITNYLIDQEYIEKIYSFQNKYGYTLNFFKPLKFPTKITYKYIDVYKIQKSLTLYYKINEKNLGELKPIVEQMFNIKIKISEQKYIELLTEYYHRKEREQTLEQYLNNAMFLFAKIQNWNNATHLEKYSFFSVDNYSGRLHSIFTELPKPIREYINKYDASIDMVAAQPTFLADFVFKHYSELFKDAFIKDVENTDIYLTLKEKFNLRTRTEAKELFCMVVFGKGYEDEAKKFKLIYPCTGQIIEEIRSDTYDKKNVSRMLQQIEVNIFRKIWKKLKELNIDFITIHDELMFNSADMDRVYNVFTEILNKELSISYELKKKI